MTLKDSNEKPGETGEAETPPIEFAPLAQGVDPNSEFAPASTSPSSSSIPESEASFHPVIRNIVDWRNRQFEVQYTRYVANDNLCLVLVNKEGRRELIATANLIGLPSNQCYVKDYSENTGVEAALIRAGIITPVPGAEPASSGHIKMRLFEVSGDAFEALTMHYNHEPQVTPPSEKESGKD